MENDYFPGNIDVLAGEFSMFCYVQPILVPSLVCALPLKKFVCMIM